MHSLHKLPHRNVKASRRFCSDKAIGTQLTVNTNINSACDISKTKTGATKTLTATDIFKALEVLEFDGFLDQTKDAVQAFQQQARGKRQEYKRQWLLNKKSAEENGSTPTGTPTAPAPNTEKDEDRGDEEEEEVDDPTTTSTRRDQEEETDNDSNDEEDEEEEQLEGGDS
ncbi:hypothetical protein HK097_011391, partial [Rhizophlyctis rosea]